jgi:inosine-uridine nucleoside N-ribohydrolase
MQFTRPGKPPVGIVFDADVGNRIDSALALAMLYGFDAQNEARVVSVSSSKSNLKSAAFCDAVAKFYAAGGFTRQLPIGLADDGRMTEDTPILTAPLAKRTAEGKPAYRHSINDINDTAEVAALIRNAFTAQHDGNCIVVLAGPATNLVRALKLPGGKELIARKVKFLALSGGAYPAGTPESHITADIASAKMLFAEWPSPIIAAGHELGAQLLFPANAIDRNFGWAPYHPVVDAYRAYRGMPYDAPSWDMAASLYAIRPQETYFKLSEPGTVVVLDTGVTQFTVSPEGRHRYLIMDPAQKDRIITAYTELASVKPVPRRRPGPPPVQQQAPKPPSSTADPKP